MHQMIEKVKNIKKNSLQMNIWLFLIAFSIFILIFLWFFQIIFLKVYYKSYKANELDKAASELRIAANLTNTSIDSIAQNRDICIEIYGENSSYISNTYNKGCMEFGNKNFKVKKDFINSGSLETHYNLINNKFKNETLIYALKLNNDTYAFINVSLEPLDSTIKILSSQFVFTTIVVLIVSLWVGYLISKKLSKPITQISKEAKKLADGNFNANFKTATDIYEINDLEDSLNYTKCELEKTENLKRDLMANVSHDLKTPLTSVIGYLTLLTDEKAISKDLQEKYIKVALDKSLRLEELTNEFFEITRYNLNDMPINKTNLDLSILLDQLIDEFYPMLEDKNLKLEVNKSNNLMYNADGDKLARAFGNLLKNAISYSYKNTTITIDMIETENNIEIVFKNRGATIPKHKLEKIFDKFYRADESRGTNSGGAGLGLAITKDIIELHNGTIEAKSEDETIDFFILLKK